jgi:hypothetical protein
VLCNCYRQCSGSGAFLVFYPLDLFFRDSFPYVSFFAEGYREGYPYDVTVSRLENEGFGFVIISSVSRAGSTIGRIIPGRIIRSPLFALAPNFTFFYKSETMATFYNTKMMSCQYGRYYFILSAGMHLISGRICLDRYPARCKKNRISG